MSHSMRNYGDETNDKDIHSSKPVITAVHGMAMGGAMELVLACHIRIHAERVRLGCPEINLDIMPE
jgi:enoyl-CoA hydratase/carnithine racemase